MEEVVNLDSDEVEEPQPVKGSQDKPTSDDAKSKSSNSRFEKNKLLMLRSIPDPKPNFVSALGICFFFEKLRS